jgi:hypothetical protein
LSKKVKTSLSLRSFNLTWRGEVENKLLFECGEGEEEEEDSFGLKLYSSSLILCAVGGKRGEEGSWDERMWRKR